MIQTNSWPAWVSAVLAAIGGATMLVLAALRGMFVTRAELRQAILDSQARIDARHQENRTDMALVFRRLSEVDTKPARIEGQLSGRYPSLNP